MDWKTLITREPELAHFERACRACREDGGQFVDFWTQNVSEITRLVGPVARCPALRSDRAYRVAHAHFLQIWIDAMSETRSVKSLASEGGDMIGIRRPEWLIGSSTRAGKEVVPCWYR